MLAHGVGVGPWSFDRLARDLAADHEVVVVHRRGYGRSAGAPASGLAAQVGDLAELGPAAFVGVSGGATLVLALALAVPDMVSAAVVHEPVVGPLAPALHAALGAAAAELATSGDAVGFVRALAGAGTWDRLDHAAVAAVADVADVVRAEVSQFLDFRPAPAQLRALAAGAFVTTVGGRSPAMRHHAAAVVAAHTGTSPVVLPEVGHLAQVDGPGALAGALRALERRPYGHQHVFPAGGGDELQPDR